MYMRTLTDKYEMLTEEERQQYGDVENYLKTIVNRMHEQGISCVLCQNDWDGNSSIIIVVRHLIYRFQMKCA